MEEKPKPDTIVDEAIGQTQGTAPPDFVKEEDTSLEEAIRRNATPPGPQASMSEKTAAALGERAGDAYADGGSAHLKRRNIDQPGATEPMSQDQPADRVFSAAQQVAQGVSEQFSDQRFVSLVAAFGLGFIVATVLRRRR